MALVSGRDSKQISARAVMLSYSRARACCRIRVTATPDWITAILTCVRMQRAVGRALDWLYRLCLSLSLATVPVFHRYCWRFCAACARACLHGLSPRHWMLESNQMFRLEHIYICACVHVSQRNQIFCACVYYVCVCVYVVRANLDSRYMRRTILTVAGAPE